MTLPSRETWWCAVAGLAVLLSGIVEYATQQFLQSFDKGPSITLAVLGTGLAVVLVRRLPWASLALVWIVPIVQTATGTPFVVTQAAFAGVAFGLARWGGTVVVWLSALSIAAGSVIAVVLVAMQAVWVNFSYSSWDLASQAVDQLGVGWRIGLVLVFAAVLGTPWLAGLTLRISDRARIDLGVASRDRVRAEETARIRDAQARLARDVHDVVGHSLAVILAQAESGQYLPDDDPAALKSALATIASSARTSLRDVRGVLTATQDSTDDLDKLIDNLRERGQEVVFRQEGLPRPLSEEQQITGYRVLQEMLTNAIRHGRRGGALIVRRAWLPGAVEVEVRNAVDPGAQDRAESAGSGVEGMRERLTAVGGSLSARADADVYVATARMPLP
jgi:signal transduction histidine kinase